MKLSLPPPLPCENERLNLGYQVGDSLNASKIPHEEGMFSTPKGKPPFFLLLAQNLQIHHAYSRGINRIYHFQYTISRKETQSYKIKIYKYALVKKAKSIIT